MAAQVGLHPAASGKEGPNLHTLPHIDAAGSLGTQEALMAGEAENIDVHFLHINVKDTGRLGGIHGIDKAVFPCDSTDPADIQQIARQIGAVCGDDGLCIGPDLFFKISVAEIAPPVCVKNGQFHPTVFQFIKGPEDGIVLQGGGDHMVTGVQHTLDGHIQRFRGIGGKGDPLRIFRSEKLCQSDPGIINDSGRA